MVQGRGGLSAWARRGIFGGCLGSVSMPVIKKPAQEKLSASSFESKYGNLVREKYAELSPHMLAKALAKRASPIEVSVGVLKQWSDNYNSPKGAVWVYSSHELDAKYGSVLVGMVKEHCSAYRLQKALKALDPPVYVTEAVAKVWFKQHQECSSASVGKGELLEHEVDEDDSWIFGDPQEEPLDEVVLSPGGVVHPLVSSSSTPSPGGAVHPVVSPSSTRSPGGAVHPLLSSSTP